MDGPALRVGRRGGRRGAGIQMGGGGLENDRSDVDVMGSGTCVGDMVDVLFCVGVRCVVEVVDDEEAVGHC